MVRFRWFAALLFSSSFCLASEIPPDEIRDLYYSGWKMPKQLTEERLESLLTKMVIATHEKGFRYLGVDEDFFHGHLLLENRGTATEKKLFPRAILYHTQEDAYGAYWRGDRDKKYVYLNVAARNWIQWLSDDDYFDGIPVENARSYVNERKRDPKQFEVEFATPDPKTHYTIHSHDLDPKKLGFQPAGQLQFEFYTHPCGEAFVGSYGQVKRPIKVAFANGDVQCLKLLSANPLQDFEAKDFRPEPSPSLHEETAGLVPFAKWDTRGAR